LIVMAIRPLLPGGLGRNVASAVADELRSLRKLADERRAASIISFRRTGKPGSPPRGKGPRDRKPLAA
jgi:hypothetical protein